MTRRDRSTESEVSGGRRGLVRLTVFTFIASGLNLNRTILTVHVFAISPAPDPVPRRLRPFYQHQWLDVLDTQDTWLEAQVVAVDPVEASEAAERELAALIADRRRGGAAQLNAPPSAAAAAPAASSSPAPPAQFGPQARRIRVHYKSFHSKYDEWLDVSSDQARDVVSRIALLHTHTRIPHPIRYPRPFKAVGDAVDCKDTINAWHAAHVVAFHDARQQVLVHYDHFDSRFDEWIDLDSYRLQPVGTFVQAAVAPASQARSAAQQRQAQLAHSHSHLAVASAAATSGACTPAQVAQFTATAANELRFRELLRSRLQSDIIDQKEDGNCQLGECAVVGVRLVWESVDLIALFPSCLVHFPSRFVPQRVSPSLRRSASSPPGALRVYELHRGGERLLCALYRRRELRGIRGAHEVGRSMGRQRGASSNV